MNIYILRPVIRFATCLILLTFTACAVTTSTGEIKITTPKSQSIPHGSTASLTVKFVAQEQQEYRDKIKQLLRKDLSVDLVAAGIFKLVSNESNGADYQIEARITKAYIVHPAARALTGILSGRSYITVQIEIRKSKTNDLFTSFQSTGLGASVVIGGQAYGYDDPVREAIAQIIQYLRK